MRSPDLSPAQTRAQDESFVRQCAFHALRPGLPLPWPTAPDIPDSPKRRYRSQYRYLGCDDLDDLTHWEYLSWWDLVVRLVDFTPLRAWLAWRLGWTSARGQVPFDPLSLFLLVSWQLVHGWSRAQALRNLRDPRYADVAQRMGFQPGLWPTEGGVRYFLTTLGLHSATEAKTVSVAVRDEEGQECIVDVALQALNDLLIAAVTLLRQAHLISDAAWQAALLCPDGMLHDAASRMRCAFVQESCYQPRSAHAPRPCPAKEKGHRGCDCDTDRCLLSCRHAPLRDPQARSVYYEGTNQPRSHPNADLSHPGQVRGQLRYGYRSLALQFSDSTRRFSVPLLDDFMPANEREENPGAALLAQIPSAYPDLGLYAVAGDAGLGYYAFLHTCYQLGARRVVDLRADRSDADPAHWTVRGYDAQGRPVCPFGYAFTANGFDAQRRRHKWVCNQACQRGQTPDVHLEGVTYPPPQCPYQAPQQPHGQVLNVAETFADGSIRLVRDIPFGTPAWKQLYHRARNASEDRNSDIAAWNLKRLPVYGQPRGRALTALADTWLSLTTLARLVCEATFVAAGEPA